ncbi:MAG: FGGY family carbohydrate kinase [Hyphomicrobiales bacterium]
MFLGIDIGTQSLKAVILDENLGLVGEGARAYAPLFFKQDQVEQDPRTWERALGPAIADALKEARISTTDVQAIGVAGQLDGCVAVTASGDPVANCLIWMDRRASDAMPAIDRETLHRITGIVADPSHLAAKARWIKTNLPDSDSIALYHQPVSYIVERLTGTRVIDHALASTSMVYGLRSRGYERSLLDASDLDARELPPIAEADQRAGRLNRRGSELTGLPEGIVVAVGTGDDFSAPLGAGLREFDCLSVAIGTGEVVGSLFATPTVDPHFLVETHAYPAGNYFVENPGWLSGGAVKWLMAILDIPDYAEFERLASAAPPGSEGLVFLPALTGAMAPEWHAGARGCFYGLTAKHGREHLARALLEGCGFAMRDVVERLITLGAQPKRANVIGGGSRSKVWAQIRADVLNLPVAIADYPHTSPIGAALLGGVAAGKITSLATACKALPKPSHTLEPCAASSRALEETYQRYRALFTALKPIFGN